MESREGDHGLHGRALPCYQALDHEARQRLHLGVLEHQHPHEPLLHLHGRCHRPGVHGLRTTDRRSLSAYKPYTNLTTAPIISPPPSPASRTIS